MVKVRIFYPADPLGIVPGGVDTFIRGLLKAAPQDICFSLVGMTTNSESRPKGKWSSCELGNTRFDFYPVIDVPKPGARSKIPLSLRYTAAVARQGRLLRQGFDVFDFHRIEPLLLFSSDVRPKNAFFHTDMRAVRDPSTDMLWRYAPGVYDAVERRLIVGLSSIWSVRSDAVEAMRVKYVEQCNKINFISTWVDTDLFHPISEQARDEVRRELAATHGIDLSAVWIVSVGRLDHSKDPGLLLASFAQLAESHKNLSLLMVGDGALKRSLMSQIERFGIDANVHLLGLRGSEDIARILAAADLFALSSAYEGMPMAVLEALGCGLPVATTDVGEIRRVVHPGINGSISTDRSVGGFTDCLRDVLLNRDIYTGEPALRAIRGYQPAIVLEPIYENYRRLVSQS